jgi:hypothetical protein
MSLAFQYHNARILINRPCLCRLDYRIPNESNRSREFNRSAAATCIGGARETVALLPDEPHPIGLISVAPWWCLLHYLVSAGAILMVEISMRAEHNPQQAEGLLNDAKKIVRWLRAMSRDSIAAERSWAVLSKLLIVSAPKIGGDTLDVERDLDGADISAVNKHRDISVQDGAPMLGVESFLDEPVAHISSDFGGPLGTMYDVQDIFRGLIDDPFPFGNIPIHSPFDNFMIVPEPATAFDPAATTAAPNFNAPFETSSSFPPGLNFPVSPDDVPTLQQQATSNEGVAMENVNGVAGAGSNDGPADKRFQKRLARGVSNISMPPPPTFPKWATADEFGMNHVGPSYNDTVERGRADLQAATGSVNDTMDQPPLSPDKTRKRTEFE